MSGPGGLKNFVTEEQIELERQRRQADWERVRSANDPIGTRKFERLPRNCLGL